jgi:CheY-like chemotaxis protein
MALKILTVDDSKTIRMIVKKAFQPYDCVLFEAENGVEGLALASKERPDLIVLDITMPVMTGSEMLGKLKAEPDLKDIPVIMLTAEAGKENVMKIVQMGVNDYMVKPFKGEQLIERAQKIVTLSERKDDPAKDNSSTKYFALDGNFQLLTLPAKVQRPTIVEVEGLLKGKLKEMLTAGMKRLILDMSKVSETNVSLIKLVIAILNGCQDASVQVRVVATAGLEKELKEFQETSGIPIDLSIDNAKAAMA